MEINITHLMTGEMQDFSASIMELGPQAGQITWDNANVAVKDALLCKDQSEIVDYFEDFGAWTREDLEAMSIDEINALLLQYIAGDLREVESYYSDEGAFYIDWKAYGIDATEGRVSSSIYLQDGKVFFTMDH